MAAENSFDIACKVDMQEVANAVNQARREVETRYDLKALTIKDPEPAAGGTVRQRITLQDGIPMEKAKEIVRLIKDSKIRVQASIQENQVRVSGKNRDDLQAIIALIKSKDLGIALQFTNYRST